METTTQKAIIIWSHVHEICGNALASPVVVLLVVVDVICFARLSRLSRLFLHRKSRRGCIFPPFFSKVHWFESTTGWDRLNLEICVMYRHPMKCYDTSTSNCKVST